MKNKIALFSGFTAILLGLAGCPATNNNTTNNGTPTPTSSSSQTTLKQVNFGSFSIAVDYAPYLVAKNKGWFDEVLKKKGITASYTIFQSLPPINESFATGKVDVVFSAENPTLVGKAAGIDLKIVALSSSLVQEILVPKNSTVKSAKDLKGKKIAVLAGTGSHYGLIKNIEEEGLQASDIEVIDMVPPDAKNAFETGKVDGWAVWPPFVEQEEISGKGRVLPQGDAKIQSVMVVGGKFAQQNPEIVDELVDVLQKSKKWIQENPTEAQQIVAKELNLPLEVVKKAWPRHDWAAQITPQVITDIQFKADFLKENQFIQNPVDVKGTLIDLSFLNSPPQSQSQSQLFSWTLETPINNSWLIPNYSLAFNSGN